MVRNQAGGVVLGLTIAQLRHWPTRWALLAAGIALTVAIPVISGGMSGVVIAQTIRRAVGQLSPENRNLLVTQEPDSVSVTGTRSEIDTEVRSQLARLTSAPVRSEIVYRQLAVNGSTFYLAGTDGLSSAVRLHSGRMPASCTPTRCEVVLLDGTPGDQHAITAAAATLGVIVVGRAVRTDIALVSGQLSNHDEPLLVGDGVSAVADLSALELFAHTFAWSAPLDVNRVLKLGVQSYLSRSNDVLATLAAKVGGTTVISPDDVLQQQDARAALSARRFQLLAGTAAVLLLGFAVIAAVGLRREQTQLVAVLRRRGASRSQVGLLVGAETAMSCLTGAAFGFVIGTSVSVVLARRDAVPIPATIGHALGQAWPAVTGLTIAAAAVCAVVLLWPDARSRTVLRSLDVVAVGCLAAALLAADRGSTSLSSGADPLVIALPVLSCVVAGLVAARLWAPAARGAELLLPRRAVAARIAVTGSARRPLRATSTAAFLTAAVASVVFAGSYRATLLAGAADQAAFQVPLDATVAVAAGDPSTNLPDPAMVEQSVPNATVAVVTRGSATLAQPGGSGLSVPIIGVDPAGIEHARLWHATTGSDTSASQLARQLQGTADGPLPELAAGTRQVRIAATGVSVDVVVSLWVRTSLGSEQAIACRYSGGYLIADLGRLGSAPLRLTALMVAESADFATHRGHGLGEGSTDRAALSGVITFGVARSSTGQTLWDWDGWGSALGQATVSASSLRLGFELQNSTLVATPAFSADLAALPVVVDPATAELAVSGRLTLRAGAQSVPARIVSVLPRLPTAGARFILADRGALATVLDRTDPGSANPSELWLATAPDQRLSALLQAMAARGLEVSSRSQIAADIRADPVGRGSRLLLVLAGALALLVAAASLVLYVLSEREDAAGELFAWECDGLPPPVLRRMLLWRTVAVAVLGVPLGVVAGVLLARAGVTLIAVDGSGTTPQPPLQLSLGSGWNALVLIGGIGAGLGCAGAVVAGSLRQALPRPAETDLR